MGPTGAPGSSSMTGATGPPSGSNITAGVSKGQTVIWNGSQWVPSGTNTFSLGVQCGETIQQVNAVAIGYQAGQTNQGTAALAIGYQAGQTNQGQNSFALGIYAGRYNQGFASFAAGFLAGQTSQQNYACAIGFQAGQNNQGFASFANGYQAGNSTQGSGALAIGYEAGYANQGTNAVAIGLRAGYTNQHANSIVINATGTVLTSSNADALFIAPIRSGSTTSALYYNTQTKEITSSTNKTFVIDHPINKNKYLVHACLEGPESGVYYRGKCEIVNNESVIIHLPDYVDALATDFTVQITPIYSGKIITLNSSEVTNNSFTVNGENCKFFWLVQGKRTNIDVEPFKSSVDVKGTGPYKWI
jgi:hypothetical protein